MGWGATRDTLPNQVQLKFSTLEQAQEYCDRIGL
jgi:hypothetical protein